MKNILLACVCLTMICPELRAQTTDKPQGKQDSLALGEQIVHDVKQSLNLTASYFNAPGKFELKDWAILGATAAATSLSIAFLDAPIRNALLSSNIQNSAKPLAPLFSIGDYYGRFYLWLGAGAITYAIGALIPHKETRELGQNILESVGLTTLSVTFLKIALGRSRPFTGEGSAAFHGFGLQDEQQSLPSLHTATAFAASTIIALKLKKWWLTIPLYALSTLTFFERMYQDQHWFSDALLGAVIGTATGIFVAICSDAFVQPKPTTASAPHNLPVPESITVADFHLRLPN